MKNPFESPTNKERAESTLHETEIYPVVNVALQQRYDRISLHWNGEAYDGTRRDDLIPLLIQEAAIQQDHVVLEAMCGTAQLSKEIRQQLPEADLYCLDFSRGMLNAAPENLKKVQSSVIAMPFPDASFDRVLIRSALYDLPTRLQLKALNEIKRVLKPNGVFLLQTYYSTPETNKALNDLVNLKDLASGQYQDMGNEYPRYFATREELEHWFDQAGFDAKKIQTFEGTIRYLRTNEMTTLGKSVWVDYVEKLPDAIKKALHVRTEPDGSLTYNFPGQIYRLTHAAT
jgi:ubiquinone/menaquinone biosynthesis C-methylase UbiE